MVADLVVLAKLKLLTASHCHGQLIVAALLGPFTLKLPFSRSILGSYTDIAMSLRFFFFRLGQIFFDGHQPIPDGSRWARALRLLRERWVDGRRVVVTQPHEASFLVASMVAL